MPARLPDQQSKPRAWRVTDAPARSAWRLMVPLGALAVVLAGVGALGVSGVFGSRSVAPEASAAPVSARPVVISSSSAVAPTATATAGPATSPAVVGGGFEPSPTRPPFVAGPPAAVQPMPVASRPMASPAASSKALASSPLRSSAGGSIESDLRSINATATALSERAAALSGSATPTRSGTARPRATETPIPTAAPPSL